MAQSMNRCPICNQSRPVKDFGLGQFQVWVCTNCGFRYLYPQPTDAELSEIYSDHYFLDEGHAQSVEMVNTLKRATAKLYLRQMVAEGLAVSGKPTLLEIGCGRGDFLLEAQAQGLGVSGLEVTDGLVAIANQRLGGSLVHKGHLEESRFDNESFDVVALFDVIEHVRDPVDFLTRISALLRRSGQVYIVTPSLDSWSAKLLGRNWMEFKLEHLSYFTKAAIVLLLKNTGFCRVRFQPNYKVLNFDYIQRHFVRFPVKGITPLMNLVRKIFPNQLAYLPFRVVASGMAVMAQKEQLSTAVSEENK
jgi:2-polyprenyl-3-methyl-5-hydroxy-6-metoxy-1,4-benzoquinol methylase